MFNNMLLNCIFSPRNTSVLLIWCFLGSFCLVHVLVTATSVQSWKHLIQHPHYADDGHQHARHVARSRNARVEDMQDVSTELPMTSYTRAVLTTKIPQSTLTDSQRRSSVNSRTHHDSVRQQSAQSVNRHQTMHNHSSSFTRSPSPAQRSDSLTSSSTVQNIISSRPTSSTTTTAQTRSMLALPQQDYYHVKGPPESTDGLERHRKTSGSSGPVTKHDIFSRMAQEIENVKQANEHFMLMRSVGRCRLPRAQVIRVKDFYPDPGKEYLPRCTLLHRCNDQAGCCDAEGFQCMPKAMQEVDLSFYVIHVDKESQPLDTGNSVTRLFFVNHTECECLPVNNSPRTSEKTSKSQQNDHHVDQNTIQNHPSKCQECPLPFCKREYPDGRCACDCFDRQRPCLRIKRGREALQESERRCVEAGKCHIPECEYGAFDAMVGRCPRKPEDQRRGQNQPKNQNHNNHRWTYFERD